MSDQPRRPVFFWLVLLSVWCTPASSRSRSTPSARYYGVEKAPGWSASNRRHGLVCLGRRRRGPGGRAHPARGPVAGDQWRRASPRSSACSNGFSCDGGKTYRVDLDRRGERVSVDVAVARRPWPAYLCAHLRRSGRPGLLHLRGGPGDSASAGRPGPVGQRIPDVGRVHHASETSAGSAFSFLVGWERIVHLGCRAAILWSCPLAYHFFSRFPTWQTSGSALAVHPVAAVRAVRAGDLARLGADLSWAASTSRRAPRGFWSRIPGST